MRKTADEFPFPEDSVRRKMGVSWTTWRLYRRRGQIKTITLFDKVYVSPEEYARLLREGTGPNHRHGPKPYTGGEPLEAAE